MLKLLLHSLVCLLGISFFVEVFSDDETILSLSASKQHSASLVDEFRFFCEDFNSFTVDTSIAEVSDRWLAHPVDSLNAKIVEGPSELNLKLGLDSSKVAILDLSTVDLSVDNQFHLEWLLDFKSTETYL